MSDFGISNNMPPVNMAYPHEDMLDQYAEKTSNGGFGAMFEQVSNQHPETGGKSMAEAAKQMETMLATFMIKTMDESGTEGGLLGKTSQGMGYFKDLFIQEMATEMVEKGGLGFAESLNNLYKPKQLGP